MFALSFSILLLRCLMKRMGRLKVGFMEDKIVCGRLHKCSVLEN